MRPFLRYLLPALLIFPLAARGTVVTTATDEDNGIFSGTGISLREAVKYSPPGDIITFAPALSGKTIRLTLGQIQLGQNLTIDASALPVPIILSGDRTGNGSSQDDSRIFQIISRVVSLRSLVITGAGANNGGAGGGNGGVHASGSGTRLTIDHCTFSDNHLIESGGAIYFSASGKELVIRDSTFTRNTTVSSVGGAVYVLGNLQMQNCTLTGNDAFRGGAIGIFLGATALVEGTTITGNSGRSSHGGIYNVGTLTLNNSMLVGNSAPTHPEISGAFGGSHNLTSGATLLAPLGDYGGPTQTMPPLPGSPAINAGGTSTLTADQRGFLRVNIPDIGAAEYQGTSDLTRFWKLDLDGDASPYGTEQALGTDPLISDPSSSRNITAPVLNASGHAVLSFGIGSAATGTHWILRRSTDLLTFTEIYRYDGSTPTAAPGVTFLRTATGVTVTDTNPPPGGGFYRFEAVFEP